MNPMQRWAMNLAIGFVVRQVAKFGEQTDWDKVKADFDVRVRKLVPGEWLDDEAVGGANFLIDAAREALAQPEAIQAVLQLCADGKWADAATKVKELVIDLWSKDADPAKVAFAVALKDAA